MVNLRVLSFDTETYLGQVKCLTMCSNMKEHSYIETDNPILLLDFLYKFGSTNNYNTFFNIKFDFSSLFKNYIVEHKQALRIRHYRKIEDDNLFQIGEYLVHYYPQKAFTIKKNKNTVYFFDIANFYKSGEGGYHTLAEASRIYLKMNKLDKDIDRKRIGSEKGYYEANKAKIIKYSIQDSYLTAKLTERTLMSFRDLGVPLPKVVFSEASFFKEFLKQKCDWHDESKVAKKFQDRHFKVIDKSYKGGIFNLFSIGKYENVYEIDINSAYPKKINELYSVVNCIYTLKENEADYKFYHIRMKPTPNLATPLGYGRLFYGTGEKELDYYITGLDKDILDLYQEQYEIIDFFGIKTEKKLLLPQIQNFYDVKKKIKQNEGKNSSNYLNVKIFLNSGYGVFAQSKPAFSKFTNFVYASYISAYCRKTIMTMKYKAEHMGEKVLYIATDSLMLKKNSNQFLNYMFNNKLINDEMGNFNLTNYKDIILFENGVYVLTDRNNKKIIKRRGLHGLTLEMLSNTDNLKIILVNDKPMSFKKAIIEHKTEDIGMFRPDVREFNPSKSFILLNPQLSSKLLGIKIKNYSNISFDIDVPNIKNINVRLFHKLIQTQKTDEELEQDRIDEQLNLQKKVDNEIEHKEKMKVKKYRLGRLKDKEFDEIDRYYDKTLSDRSNAEQRIKFKDFIE